MRNLLIASLTLAVTIAAGLFAQIPVAPAVGSKAPEFILTSIQGKTVRLSDEFKNGPVVLVLLRGWPGYQCPFCTRQFGDYLGHAADLERANARVVFVYPGPTDRLREHAEAFIQSREMPANFTFLLDPDYTFTNAYGLRWNAPSETAYPSTFILDKTGRVRFARTSTAHGDRVPVVDVLKALEEL